VAFGAVQNPFQQSHGAGLGLSSASAAYDFSWSGDAGAFDIQVTQHLEGLEGRTLATGRIDFVPMVETTLSIDASLVYSLPSFTVNRSILFFLVYDYDLGDVVGGGGGEGGTFGLHPPVGSLLDNQAIMLRAGHHYLFRYEAWLEHYGSVPPGAVGSATGEFHFDFEPVPEPAGLASLATALLLRPRRRNHARHPGGRMIAGSTQLRSRDHPGTRRSMS
jgi:hypothetical protein